jgi:hypothetical protein
MLLEVTDLDHLCSAIAGLEGDLNTTENLLLTKFDTCGRAPAFKHVFSAIQRGIPKVAALTTEFAEAARILIHGAGQDVPEALDERLATIETILADRRSKTFPVRGFTRKPLAGWNTPSQDSWRKLDDYLDERRRVDEDTRRLVTLFDEALKLPAIADAGNAVECPLCGTESALTPGRIALIRQHVEDTKGFKTAETASKSVLTQLSASADALVRAGDAGLPAFLNISGAERHQPGFTVHRIRELLGVGTAGLVDPWLVQVRLLARARTALRRGALMAQALVAHQLADLDTAFNPDELRAAFTPLAGLHTNLTTAIDAYTAPALALGTALNAVLDAQSNTEGWQDFLDIAAQPSEIRAALIDRQATAAVARELDAALKQIDRAKELVFDDKFSDYSDLIEEWWNRLRPDEATFFSAVQPRKGARRTINFKAGLSPNPDRSAPKLRDVIAVFSQSQLHCLGLALFLARAQHEGLGFIILDDRATKITAFISTRPCSPLCSICPFRSSF